MNSINELFASNRILLECSCSSRKPFTQIFFCRHCNQLSCKDCVNHEVDSPYCMQCLEYILSTDTKLKSYVCSNCFLCPHCMNNLTPTVFLAKFPSELDREQLVEKKAKYLICHYCKWNSLDAGLPVKLVGSGWPEIDTPNKKLIETIFDYYRYIAKRERIEKEKKRIAPKPKTALYLLDKYGIASSFSARFSLRNKTKSSLTTQTQSPYYNTQINEVSITPSEPTENVDALNVEEFYNKEFNEMEVSSLEQRLAQIELQPDKTSQLYPISRLLHVKRTLRCKCGRYLVKPEYNSSSIKFKVQQSASFSLPKLAIHSGPKLISENPFDLVLTLENPFQHSIVVNIEPFNKLGDDINSLIEIPINKLLLEGKNPASELENELGEKYSTVENEAIIKFASHKIGLKAKVTPQNAQDSYRMALTLKCTVNSTGDKSDFTIPDYKIILNLGSNIQ